MSSLKNLKLSMINSHVKIEKSKLNNCFKKIKSVKIEGLWRRGGVRVSEDMEEMIRMRRENIIWNFKIIYYTSS